MEWSGRTCVSRRAPAARGCRNGGREDVLLGEFPLRGAAGMVGGRAVFLGEPPLRGAAGMVGEELCF